MKLENEKLILDGKIISCSETKIANRSKRKNTVSRKQIFEIATSEKLWQISLFSNIKVKIVIQYKDIPDKVRKSLVRQREESNRKKTNG